MSHALEETVRKTKTKISLKIKEVFTFHYQHVFHKTLLLYYLLNTNRNVCENRQSNAQVYANGTLYYDSLITSDRTVVIGQLTNSVRKLRRQSRKYKTGNLRQILLVSLFNFFFFCFWLKCCSRKSQKEALRQGIRWFLYRLIKEALLIYKFQLTSSERTYVCRLMFTLLYY